MRYRIIVIFCLLRINIGLSNSLIEEDVARMLLRFEKDLISSSEDSLKIPICYQKINILLKNHLHEPIDFEMQRLDKLGGLREKYKHDYAFIFQTFYQEKKYNSVYHYFEQTTKSLSSEMDKTLWYYYLSSLMHEEELSKLKFAGDELKSKLAILEKTAVDSLEEYKEKNYKAAKTLQSIIPGSGLIALGYYRKGITNLVLNTGFALLAGHYVAMHLIAPTIVYGVYPFGKFYFGTQRHLSYLIDQKNQTIKKDTFYRNDERLYRFCKRLVF